MSQKTARRAARSAMNGALGSVLAQRGPVGVGRGAVSRSLGTLGAPGSLGPLSDASGGFGGRPSSARTRPGAALSGRPATATRGALGNGPSGPSAKPTRMRPRPGRGTNGVLALAATPYYTAMDRIKTR